MIRRYRWIDVYKRGKPARIPIAKIAIMTADNAFRQFWGEIPSLAPSALADRC